MTHTYHKFTKLHHWGMGALLIFMVVLGFIMSDFSSDLRPEAYGLHKSIGIVLLIWGIVRITTRIMQNTPTNPGLKPFEWFAAKAVHYGLYLAMFVMPISGYTMSVTNGHPVAVFSLNIPDLIGKNKTIGSIAHEAHEVMGLMLALLIGLHLIAFLKHLIIDRINLLRRIT